MDQEVEEVHVPREEGVEVVLLVAGEGLHALEEVAVMNQPKVVVVEVVPRTLEVVAVEVLLHALEEVLEVVPCALKEEVVVWLHLMIKGEGEGEVEVGVHA